jgi:hypothetical protein
MVGCHARKMRFWYPDGTDFKIIVQENMIDLIQGRTAGIGAASLAVGE